VATALGSDNLLTVNIDPSNAEYQMTLEPINGAELVFSGNRNYFRPQFRKKCQSTTELFHCDLPLFPVQLRDVIRVDIVAKSNQFTLPTNLV